MKEIKKRFPTLTDMEELHFLNDKKINGELYAVLLANSEVRYDSNKNPYTYCRKDAINLSQLCKKEIFNCTRQTLSSKLKYLEERGYIKSDSKGYIILMPELAWKDLSLETIKYLLNVYQKPVIRTYLYLGVRYNWKKKENENYYDFSKTEILNHCGIPIGRNAHGYQVVSDILNTLMNAELIKYHIVKKNIVNKNIFYYNYRLTNWQDHPKNYNEQNIPFEEIYENVDDNLLYSKNFLESCDNQFYNNATGNKIDLKSFISPDDF
jgi:hypothetical protein